MVDDENGPVAVAASSRAAMRAAGGSGDHDSTARADPVAFRMCSYARQRQTGQAGRVCANSSKHAVEAEEPHA